MKYITIEKGDKLSFFSSFNGRVLSGVVVDFDLYTRDPVVDNEWGGTSCPAIKDIMSVNEVIIDKATFNLLS